MCATWPCIEFGVVALRVQVDLDRLVARPQRVDPRRHTLDRASRVGLARDHQHGRAHRVDVGHRVAPRVPVGHLLGLPP